jgi:hypothetical protein
VTGKPCKSGRTTFVRGKQRPFWHNTKEEIEACPFCTPKQPGDPGTIAAPPPPNEKAGAPGSSPAPGAPAPGAPAPRGAVAAAFGGGPAEVLSTGKGKKLGVAVVWDGYLDATHVRMFWNDIVLYWVRNAQLAVDRFILKVDFHIPDDKFKISDFADRQLERDQRNYYTVWSSNVVRWFKPVDQNAAYKMVEDVAMLSNFAGLMGAFYEHYHRAWKESPVFEKARKAKAERVAKLAALKAKREAATEEAERRAITGAQGEPATT